MAKKEVVVTAAARTIAAMSVDEPRAKRQAAIERQLDRFFRMGVEAGQEQFRQKHGVEEPEEVMSNEPPRMNRRDLLCQMAAMLHGTAKYPPDVAVASAKQLVRVVDKQFGINVDELAQWMMEHKQ